LFNNNNNIFLFLSAASTAKRPITDTAQNIFKKLHLFFYRIATIRKLAGFERPHA
jgi:hypothetical protein